MKEFKVGTEVTDRYDRFYKGTVTEVVSDEEIVVKWQSGDEDHYEPEELHICDPEGDRLKAKQIQPKIDQAAEALEHAFKLWQEAQDAYSKAFDGDAYGMRNDDLVDMSRFHEAFEHTGWSTSGGRNLYC